MKIYKDILNEIKTFSIPENVYNDNNTFEIYLKTISKRADEIFYSNDMLKANFLRVILEYCRPGKDYILHKFKEYYAISQICDVWEPIEVSNEIKCFDEDRVYPLQEIEIKLDWKY